MFFKSWVVNSGSPPQVRGKQDRLVTYFDVEGITPAGAGKTSELYRAGIDIEDHPRRCGENAIVSLLTSLAGRITPAGAGKTLTGWGWIFDVEDHPRRCGENDTVGRAVVEILGSPPQVRGKLRKMYEKFGQDRITPAGAGKTGCIKPYLPLS